MDSTDIELNIPSWAQIWAEICPVEKRGTNTLDECQQICLQIIILVFISAASAYHFGRQLYTVVRTRRQIWTIRARIAIVGSLGILPVARTYFKLTNDVTIWPIDILLSCFECITWIVHLGFQLSLRRRGSVNSRGPLIITVLWAFAFVLSITWLQEGLSKPNWGWRLPTLVLQFLYGLTLIPAGQGRLVTRLNRDEEERQALLSNRYVRFQQGAEEASLGPAQDGVACLSRLLFYWVNDLIEKGVEGALRKVEDLFDLPDCLSIVSITERFQKSIDQTKTIFWALHKSFGREFYTIGLLRFLGDISGFAGPLLLGGLIGEETSETSPFLYAFGLFGSAIVAAISGVHFNWRISLVTMRMRVAIVTAIYRKSLEARGLKNARPDILNLMSTDTDRIVNSCVSFHSFWSIPFQLFTTLYLLYTQVGVAFVAGVLFAVALIPINRWLALRIAKLSQGLMMAKDARVSLCSEALAGAKQIKLYAWEDIFVKRIKELRGTELKFLAKRKYLDAVCVYFWATTPILMCLLTFGMSVLTGNILTPATTYTSVALLNMLIGPLNAFPWVLNGLTEAWVSLKRVQELMSLPNIDLTQFYSPVENTKSQRKERPVVLSIEDATFDFEFTRQRDGNEIVVDDVVDFRLEEVSLVVKKGELVCLEGPVGGGKSSLLSAIVADLSCASGTVSIQDLHSGFGYVGQSPWLQRGTIRENIVWGAVFDEQRYKSVVNACALTEDLMQLGGDHVGVGEGGQTLSGGQRARVALARAVYQNKAIYLMDDVLSALDAHVASHIVKHCLLGLLATKTRIIISENRTLLLHASQILHVNGGRVTHSELMNDFSDDETEEMEETGPESVFTSVQLEASIDEEKKSVDSIMLEESREYGTIKSGVIFSYWKAMSNAVAFTVFLAIILMQASRNISDVWLAHWVSQYGQNTTGDPSVGYFLGIYAGLATSNSAFTLIRAFLFAYAGIRAAQHVHQKLLKRVFAAKFQFFDVTPLGRILNRFSSDTYTIDDSLPFIFNILLAQIFGLAGAIIITLIALPWLILLIVPMCPVYVNLQSRYRHASRDIKRLSSNALSPLYAHFTETLRGMTTIRAMRASGRFRRDFLVKVEESTRAQLAASAAQQWLALRLQFLGATLVGGAGILAALTSTHETDPSFVGLAISYALSITSLLGGVLNALAETEQELIAVERVSQYCDLEGEVNASGGVDPPFGWPCQGVVSFDNVVMKYRDHLPPSLNRVSFETSAFERLGIVGRTGAGKTSIVAGIMRVAPLALGKIVIDCVDVATLPVKELRRRIALVPQEPFLFGGTVRDNLDPRREHFESEIWSAISACLAAPLVHGLGGLGGFISPGGANVSAGERQLLSLARAMLKKSKVVCIDEGTANLNAASEIAIRSVLRTAFRSSTVIFIAHRLSGLQNTERIFVMDGGEIVESGPPSSLQADRNSLFHGMLQEQALSDPTYKMKD
ncbi:ATP-binding cassette sub-family C member 10 [Phlebotomus argentipes]|uniref:ATP-binding cassette sub-family C member 10 n=1 Tax=Phlebotomus argentipes TaxID=94469 RepID=UPI002893359E|nr:ATP-binding cassette sub-family C member 10 [Phlebotomus argentipes]